MTSRVLQPDGKAIGTSINNANIANNVNAAALNANVITVFEHQRLTARDFVRVADFHWLLAQEFAVFSIKRKQGQWQLKVGHYIGIILLPSGMTLEILPKPIIKLSDSYCNRSKAHDINQTRHWVQAMLADLAASNHTKNKLPNSKNLGQFSTQIAALPLTALPLSDWLVAQFLERLSHYQPTKHYQTQIHNQAALQGRLLIKEQLRRNSLQPHKFVCESSVLNQEILSNRLIKSALERLTPLLPASIRLPSFPLWQSISALNRYELMQLTPLYQQAKRQLGHQPLSRQQRQAVQQLLDLAYWLLKHTSADTGNGIAAQTAVNRSPSQPRLCLLIDMNQAFEQWASLCIAAQFQQIDLAYEPLFQAQRVWLNDAKGQACLSIRPDLLIYKTTRALTHNENKANDKQDIDTNLHKTSYSQQPRHYSHVIDMKWKHLAQPGAINAQDAYQLSSYAQAYQVEQVWLVYPVQDTARRPVVLRQQDYDNDEKVDANKAQSRQSNLTQLWLMPFNVLTGTINGGLLPDINVV